jgi:hypothetical protein
LLATYKHERGCVLCGEREPVCLDFHHLNPREKSRSVSAIWTRGCSWDTIQKEIEKCILLCANCHRKVHAGIVSIPTPTGCACAGLFVSEGGRYATRCRTYGSEKLVGHLPR